MPISTTFQLYFNGGQVLLVVKPQYPPIF